MLTPLSQIFLIGEPYCPYHQITWLSLLQITLNTGSEQNDFSSCGNADRSSITCSSKGFNRLLIDLKLGTA